MKAAHPLKTLSKILTRTLTWMMVGGLALSTGATLQLLLPDAMAWAIEPGLEDDVAWLQQTSQRWIEIDTTQQRLTAWEGNTPVYAVVVSTGRSQTPTPSGVFAIQSMHRTARMQGADYDIPDVPYTMYYSGSYAIHGAYWHRNFGTPVSHGCVNVAVDHAAWLFNWVSVGTPVLVHQ